MASRAFGMQSPENPSKDIFLHGLVADCPALLQLRLMCQFSNSVTVEVMPPYIPTAAEKADPALYAANIRKLIVSRWFGRCD